MVFKQLGDDTDKFAKKFGLFSKTFKDIGKDLNSGLGIKGLFNVITQKDVSSLNSFVQAIKNGTNYTEAFNTHLEKAPIAIKRQANEIIKLNNQQIKLNTQLRNHKITQEQYNTVMAANKAQMTALTTGTQKLTLAQRAATIASKAMGVALNLALNVGLMLAINLIITGIMKIVNAEKELRKEATETGNTYKELTKSMKDVVSQYEAILDSDKSAIEKTEELNAWKRELIDTYGFEKEKLKELNEERAEGIKLLEEEIKKATQRDAAEWLGTYDKQFEDAKKAINTDKDYKFSISDISSVGISSAFNWSEIDERLLKYLNIDDISSLYTANRSGFSQKTQTADFSITGDNLIEQYESIQEMITILGGITKRTREEQALLDELNKQSSKIKKKLDEHQSNYELGYSNEATIHFEDYISDGNEIENVGQDSYTAWRDGLLKMANGDKVLEQELLKLAENQFPDYAEYFNNLERAYSQFGIDDNINNAKEGIAKQFIDSLSNEDLAIVLSDEFNDKFPNLFDEGLDGASKKLEKWKKQNPIETEVKITIDSAMKQHSDKINIITSAMEDMENQGYLSIEMYSKLNEIGGNFVDCLELENGKIKLNVDKLKDLETQEYKNTIAANALTIAELEMSKSRAIAAGADYSAIQALIDNLKEENAQWSTLITEIYNAKPNGNGSGSGTNTTPTEIQNYLDAYEKYNHDIIMGIKAKDQEYFDWVAQESEKAYSKYPEYLKDLWKYQEEVYEGRKQLADDYLNDRIEDREAQIEITLDTSKADDGTKLNTKEKFDYVRDCYREILAEIETRINDLIQSGVATNSEAIQELEKQAQEYRDKLDGILTDEIETEIDYLKNMQDEWDKVYDDKIDAIEKEKSAMEERYDSEIEALQKANDEKQKEYDIEKARQELEKASQRTRKVYGADGTVGYRQDTEAVTEAQKNLDDLLVEKQIEALEEQKALETEKFDKQIELLEQEQTAKQEFYNKLLEILENYLNPKATESNSNVWESVLGDTENVKKSNGNVEVKGADVDTSSLKKGILNSVDIINWLEKLGASTDIIKAYANGTGNATTMSMQTSMNNTASKQFDNQHKTSAWSASRDDYKLASANQNENVTYAIGDIHIHNPVGNSNDLATEFAKHLTLAIHKQTYTNLKK